MSKQLRSPLIASELLRNVNRARRFGTPHEQRRAERALAEYDADSPPKPPSECEFHIAYYDRMKGFIGWNWQHVLRFAQLPTETDIVHLAAIHWAYAKDELPRREGWYLILVMGNHPQRKPNHE